MPPAVRYKHLARYREIARVLFEEGFGYLLDEFGLTRFLRATDRLRRREERGPELTLEERARITLERLGPTFVKIGQILSTRPDLIPESFVAEFKKLQDAVPPVPFEAVRSVVEAELGAPIDEVFASFEREPLAAASIGQVHAAVLPGGEDVVVKVQRPDIVRAIDVDLDILMTQTQFVERTTSWGKSYDVTGYAEEVGHVLRAELDYLREGRNAERFRENFAEVPKIAFPKVYWDFTTRCVITEERFRGIKLDDVLELEEAHFSRSELAHRGVDAYLKMVFIDGFFHADPHPGNVFVLADGTLAFTDFGRVGIVTRTMLEELSDLFIALVDRDEAETLEALMAMRVAQPGVDEDALRSELSRLFARYYDAPLQEIRVAEVVGRVMHTIRVHQLRLPSEYALPLATFVVLEGVGQQLDPSFNLVQAARPFARRILTERYSPVSLWRRVAQSARHASRLLFDLPESLTRLIRRVNEGNLHVEVGVSGLDRYIDEVKEMVNRIAFAILVSSFVIGLSYLLQKETLPRWAIALFAITLIAAAGCGAWFFVSIFLSMFKAWRKRS